MIRIFNLNLWNYNLFEKRKSKIIKHIQIYDPDLIVFQEVRDDSRFNEIGENQLQQINLELNYKYQFFCPISDRKEQNLFKHRFKCLEGIGILSKHPITNLNLVPLTKRENSNYLRSNIVFTINKVKLVDIIVVHFNPSNKDSKLDLLETLDYIKEKSIKPIIIGDFNLSQPSLLRDLTIEEFSNSYDFKNYISYPKKNLVLDYVLIPKKFKFNSLICIDKNISDHKALVVDIDYL